MTRAGIVLVNEREFKRTFARWETTFEKIYTSEIKKEGKKMETAVRKRIRSAPRVDTGNLAKSITHRVERGGSLLKLTGDDRGIVTVIEASGGAAQYAVFVEKDTRPHFPPVDALRPWAIRHGVSPWAVARKIEREGTTGIHMFEDTYQEWEQKTGAIIERIRKRIEREF